MNIAEVWETDFKELENAQFGEHVALHDLKTDYKEAAITAGKTYYPMKNAAGELISITGDDLRPVEHPKGAAVIMGDIHAPTAFIVDDWDDGERLFSVLPNTEYKAACVLITPAKVSAAKEFGAKQIIITATLNQKDEMLAKLAGVNGELWLGITDLATILDNGDEVEKIPLGVNRWRCAGGEFVLSDDGLWHITDAKDDEPSKKTWLSPPLYVDGLTRNKNGTNWGKYIRTKDQDGNTHRFILTDDKLQGDAREWRKLLAAHGCSPSNKPHAKQLLSDYLHRHPTKTRYTTVSSSGWHGDVYVLPNAVFGANNVLLDKEFATHHSQKGSLSDWQENIAKECIKHDRLTLGLCMAFGGALLELMNMQSIGVHLVSSSSQGKTLTLNLACSVWGKPSDLLKTWNFTANGLEMIVSLHNDNFLALDELGQIGAKEAAKVVYMLGNGAGKGRATKDLSLQDVRTWRTCWLSTGEITLSQKLAEIGKSAHAGELMRMIHLPANSEQGSVFDDVEVGEQGRKLHSRLNDYASRFYGTAGTAWLEYLTADKKGMAELAGGLYDEFMAGFGDLSQQQGRVLGYFALMATAGELATRAGITGWQDGQASQAIANLYHVWLANNKDDLQTAQAIEAIQHFIEQHQFSRFVNATEPSFTPSDIRHTANFAGYITNIKDVGVVYAFNQSAFDEAIKKHGLSRDVCLNILKNHDFLHCNDGGRFKAKIRIENGKNPLSFYAIKAKILEFSKN